jgi:succinate dehydrogenase flavin-adding protein (antitoxin of CptAB toxin-antitoxin module)
MAKKDISTASFDEFLSYLSLCAVTDAQIADWINNNAPLSKERAFQLVQMVELTKGDRGLSPALTDALKQRIGDLRAA